MHTCNKVTDIQSIHDDAHAPHITQLAVLVLISHNLWSCDRDRERKSLQKELLHFAVARHELGSHKETNSETYIPMKWSVPHF